MHDLVRGLPFWVPERAHAVLTTDSADAAFENESGGILFAGSGSEPPILEVMLADPAA